MERLETLYEMQKSISSIINDIKTTEKNNSKKVEVYKRDKTELITCKEAAKLYPIGEQKFRELCKSTNKTFPSIKIGCRHYIVKNKLDEWLMEKAIGEEF